MRTPAWPAAVAVAGLSFGCAISGASARHHDKRAMVSPALRMADLRRAQVWMPTDVSKMNLRAGPDDPGAFPPDALVPCDYVDKPQKGRSPKFTCSLKEHDEVKVKYGLHNGEVYAEVAATRLLWALGFGADHMYPVRIECRGCPPDFRGPAQPERPPVLVEAATIERKMPGRAIETHEESGWGWTELDAVDERAGGAPRAQIDALRLLAAFIQHTDSKPEQQRLMCLSAEKGDADELCAQPFLMLNDVGQTFGHANRLNRDAPGSVNFDEWSHTPIWSDPNRCVANISKSLTGTLDHPVISEEGRKFLADRMAELSDVQLHDLFEVSHFERRSGHTADEWVDAFKRKRDEIVNQRCPR
jgi:hypothetical protein